MATDFVRCDGEFSKIEEDLDMTNFGAVKRLTAPVEYSPLDITRELAMLERYAQKGEKMVKVGTKVIVRTCKEYGGRLTGKVGTVSQLWHKNEKVGVLFDDIKNPESKNGLFWIYWHRKTSLEECERYLIPCENNHHRNGEDATIGVLFIFFERRKQDE